MEQFAHTFNRTHIARLVRTHLYLARMLAAALLAIGISGAVCQVAGYTLGDHALAADQQVAQPSEQRCAEYREYAPGKPTCAAAEMAHHADEVVTYRLAAGVLGLLAAAAYFGVRWLAWFTDDEARTQHRCYLFVAIASFGVAAAALLGTGIGAAIAGGGAAPRWFIDGGVAAAFFAAHRLWLRASVRKAALP